MSETGYKPKWFMRYMNKKQNIILTFIAIIITGIGAFSKFPKPPPLILKFLDNPKNIWMKWALVYLLIWQGRFGDFTFSSLAQSLNGTLILYVIYHTDYFQMRIPELYNNYIKNNIL